MFVLQPITFTHKHGDLVVLKRKTEVTGVNLTVADRGSISLKTNPKRGHFSVSMQC